MVERPGKIVAHTPDPNRYFQMPGAVMIPLATDDGRSRASDPSKPGSVLVAREGGPPVLMDFSRLNPSTLPAASLQAHAGSIDAVQTYEKLAGAAPTAPPYGGGVSTPAPYTPPPLPSAPVREQPREYNPVPAAEPFVPSVSAVGPVPVASYVPPSPPAPAAYPAVPPRDPAYAYAQPASDPLAALREQVEALSRLVSAGLTAGPGLAPAAVPTRPSAVTVGRPWEPQPQPPADVAATTLGLTFLGDGAPQCPGVQVDLEIGPSGTISQHFHFVELHSRFVLLVYDTRYHGGSRWVPPTTPDPASRLTLTCSSPAFSCSCALLHLRFRLGVLDVICVLRLDGDEEA